MRRIDPTLVFLLVIALGAACVVSGCARTESTGAASTAAARATPERTFDTPEGAVEALVAALENRDKPELQRLLGLDSDELLSSGDPVADSTARVTFLERYREKHHLVSGGPDDVVLMVGADEWPFPIPLVRRDGRWHLDGPAGMNEIVMRRIGANELRTIDVMRGYVVAQDEYASTGHDGIPSGSYAQVLRSDPGKRNGLYWEAAAGEPESPAGPFLAAASAEGYAPGGGGAAPYHGYRYKPLLSQGPSAPGGAKDFVVDGRQSGGFALVAWPASYGESGVMTFQVNQDGVVWQKDLGTDTEQAASAMTRFDPDSTWTPIPEESATPR